MNQKKKVTVVITSCINCPIGHWNDEHHTLYCRKVNKYIEPSKKEPMAIYYHDIPKDCPFPDTDEPET